VTQLAPPRALTREEREQALRLWWQGVCREARSDVNRFVELSLKNDQADASDTPFKQQWFHREWHAAWMRERITVLHGATGYGKSEQIIGHLLWRMGLEPRTRIAIVGKKADNAAKLLKKIKRQIEQNETIRSIFPELRPGDPWNDERLRVKGAGIDTTTNTVEVYGIDGSPQGLRADIIVLDDVIDFENTLTDYQRQKTIDFVDAVIQSRLTTGGKLHILANAWHPDDLAFTYAKRPGIWHGVYPAENPVTGELLWPSFRSREWLDQKKSGMSPSQYSRMFLCHPRDEGTRIFKAEWLAFARTQGAGLRPRRTVTQAFTRDGRLRDQSTLLRLGQAMRDRMTVVVGVDLATGKNEKKRQGDFTVFFVLGVDSDGRRHVLWIEKGRWSVDETLSRMRAMEARYQPDRFMVEDNGAQVFLAQFARKIGFETPIEDFTTTSKKWDESLGIEGIGVEMRAGAWVIPGPAEGQEPDAYLASLAPDERAAYQAIGEWQQHLLDFTRGPHTSDIIMASYFAKEGALRLGSPIFHHDRAGEMASPPPDQLAARIAGGWDAIAAAFPPVAPSSPLDAVPEHIRKSFGL
jgi:hypothetical protein